MFTPEGLSRFEDKKHKKSVFWTMFRLRRDKKKIFYLYLCPHLTPAPSLRHVFSGLEGGRYTKTQVSSIETRRGAEIRTGKQKLMAHSKEIYKNNNNPTEASHSRVSPIRRVANIRAVHLRLLIINRNFATSADVRV